MVRGNPGTMIGGIGTARLRVGPKGLGDSYESPSCAPLTLNSNGYQLVKRPSILTGMQRIALYANHFKVEIPDIKVYVYDIQLRPGKLVGADFRPQFRKQDDKRLKKQLQEVNRTILDKIVKKCSTPGALFHDALTQTVIRPVYDGVNNFYTRKLLKGLKPGDKTKYAKEFVTLESHEGWNADFEAMIRFATTVDLSTINHFTSGIISEAPADAIKAIDIILRHGPTIHRIPLGNGLFPRVTQLDQKIPLNLEGDKYLTFGHFQSLKPCAAGATLNIDRLSASFMTDGPILEVIGEIFFEARGKDSLDRFLRSNYLLNQKSIETLRQKFKQLKVSANHLSYKKKFKIGDFTPGPASAVSFIHEVNDDNGKTITTRKTVADYFKEVYKRDLKYADCIPCVKSGSLKRPVYYPLEVIEVEAHQHLTRMTPVETSSKIKICSTQDIHERFQIIKEAAVRVENDSKGPLEEFGLKMDVKPLEVNGLVLKHPILTYGTTDAALTRGRWDMSGHQVYRSCPVEEWVVINMVQYIDAKILNRFVENLMAQAEKMDVEMKSPRCEKPNKYIDASFPTYRNKNMYIIFEKKIKRLFAPYKPDLVIFVFPEKNDEMYRDIKYCSDIRFGLRCQCVSERAILRMDNLSSVHLLQNIIMKINTKMECVNWIINRKIKSPFLTSKTMVIGADVSHPTLNAISSSIAAVTASQDKHHYFYTPAIRIQMGFSEIIQKMKSMMIEVLENYHEKNSSYPESIIFYRDGVSDGMFREVLRSEVQEMMEAFKYISSRGSFIYKPKLTLIIVQKRHHTRFEPMAEAPHYNKTESPVDPPVTIHKVDREEEDKMLKCTNPPAGTTVDTGVVHPTDFDFYLQSHVSLTGTSRPTHYYVLMDENKITSEEMYRMTFQLCHTFAPSCRSLSIPAPVQYAHLAAKRSRHHLIYTEIESRLKIKEWKRFSEKQQRHIMSEMNSVVQVDSKIAHRMYFI